MKKRFSNRAQSSMEFIMVVAISMMILLPGIYLFRNFAFESNDNILKSRLNEISDTVLSRAKKIHYYGPPSKTTIIIDMPPQVDSIYVIANPTNPDYTENYLGFTILTSKGSEEILYYSDIPLKLAGILSIDQCLNVCGGFGGFTECECGNSTYYSKGLKNIQLEASKDCNSGYTFCVIISLV